MLATLPDYEVLYGAVADPAPIEARLAAASSLIQERAAKQTIALVLGDVATFEDDGSGLLQLPQLPVVQVTEVAINGAALDASRWRLLPGGQVRLLGRRLDSCQRWGDPDLITVTNDHGFDPIPAWIVERVCSMVHRAIRPEAMEGISQEATGSQSISYVATAAGANIWLTRAEVDDLRALFPPVIA